MQRKDYFEIRNLVFYVGEFIIFHFNLSIIS